MQLRCQLFIAADNLARAENLSRVRIPTTSKCMDEQLKLAQNIVDVVDRPNRKICVTQLRYIVHKPDSSYARVQLFAGRKEDEMFQQTVFVIYKLEEDIYLFDAMNSVYDKVISNHLICSVL